MERRVEVTQVGAESYYHMDDIIGEEEMAVWSQENEEEDEQSLEIPDALWSDAPLDRVPPDPPKWVDDLADEVEEKRAGEAWSARPNGEEAGGIQEFHREIRAGLESQAENQGPRSTETVSAEIKAGSQRVCHRSP